MPEGGLPPYPASPTGEDGRYLLSPLVGEGPG